MLKTKTLDPPQPGIQAKQIRFSQNYVLDTSSEYQSKETNLTEQKVLSGG